MVDSVLHGLDRGVWYIPASGPRPRYEEQVASQNQSALCTVVLEVAGQSIAGGSGDYWKPPISCHEQSPPVQQGCILLYNQLTDRPFISTEVEAINLAKVYSRLRMEVKRKTK